MKLRTGDGVGTAVYIQMGDEPSHSDELLAVFLDPARAQLTVEIANGFRPPLQTAYTITDAEAAEVLRLSEQESAVRWRESYTGSYPVVDGMPMTHTTGPGRDEPIFGPDSREITDLARVEFPIISKCVCGRQIIAQTRGADWEYCGA